MLRAWAATADSPPPPGAGAPATPELGMVAALVDKYVRHPAQQDGWQPIIRAEALKA
jgi:hypothetical protein